MTAATQPYGVTLTLDESPPEWFPFLACLFVATIHDAAGIRIYGPLSMN